MSALLSKSIVKIGNIEICEQYYYDDLMKHITRYVVYHNECRRENHRRKNRIPHFFYPEQRLNEFMDRLIFQKYNAHYHGMYPNRCCWDYRTEKPKRSDLTSEEFTVIKLILSGVS